MNDLIKVEAINPIEVFTTEGIDPFLRMIQEEVSQYGLSIDTAKGRKEVASVAYKIAQSKTTLDSLGKELVAEWKQKAKTVDESRKKARDFLDNLKAEVRGPLTAWEIEDKARKVAEALEKEIDSAWENAILEDQIVNRIKELEAEKQRLDKIEEERLAKELAEVALREQMERDAQIALESAERAKREAEERIKRVEQEKAQALKQAEIEKEQAIEQERRIAKAEAIRVENQRIANEKSKDEYEAKRIADQDHQNIIHGEIIADLMKDGAPESIAQRMLNILIKGGVRHVSIKY